MGPAAVVHCESSADAHSGSTKRWPGSSTLLNMSYAASAFVFSAGVQRPAKTTVPSWMAETRRVLTDRSVKAESCRLMLHVSLLLLQVHVGAQLSVNICQTNALQRTDHRTYMIAARTTYKR